MPIVKLLNRNCKAKLDNQTECLLRNSLNNLSNDHYRELYNNLYGKLYKHKKFKLLDEIKIRISSLKKAKY